MESSAPPIVHAVTPGPVGGLESVVLSLAAGQRRAGRRVAVVSVVEREDPAHPFHRALREAGIELLVLPLPGRSYRREVGVLSAIFDRLAPEVVHTHGYRSDVLAGRAARRLRLPTVSTAHGFTGGGWKNRLYEWLQLRAWRRFSAVVAVSSPLFDRLRRAGVAPGRLHRIPNAWDQADARVFDRDNARRELGLDSAGLVLGWVGRLTREKGADILLDAVSRLGEPSLRVSVLGAGREQPLLEARCRALGLEDRVRFHGVIPAAHRFYRAFDLFVLSSRTEGTPICLFEAMAARVPVVAARVGGVPDVVGPGEAILVGGEDPDDLAAGIRSILNDPRGAEQRALAARDRLDREFAAGPWVARYLQLYASLHTPRPEQAAP